MHYRSTEFALLVAAVFEQGRGPELLLWLQQTDFALNAEWITELVAQAEQQKTAATSAAAVPD